MNWPPSFEVPAVWLISLVRYWRTFAQSLSPRVRRTTMILSFTLAIALLTGPVGSVALAAPPAPHAPTVSYDWLQFNGDAQHSGNNRLEKTITISKTLTLGRLFRIHMPDTGATTPVALTGVNVSGTPRDLLFVTTEHGMLLAIDAHTGAQVWSVQHGPGDCKVNLLDIPCFTTASPVLDPNRQYVYAYGLDGTVHKHQVADGSEIADGIWPEIATLNGRDEKGSSNLATAIAKDGTPYLYVTHAGYGGPHLPVGYPGDAGDYQGHVTAINLNTGAQQVFNALCSNKTTHLAPGGCPNTTRAGIWARPGVVYSSDTDKIYMVTGNGPYNPAGHNWGDTIFALGPDGKGTNDATGNPLDSYTPQNYAELQAWDLDLGSSNLTILPVPANSNVPHLAVQVGKDAILRLINLDNLSGQGGPGHIGGEVGAVPLPQGGEVLSTPAVWVNPGDGNTWVFVSSESGLSGLRLVIGANETPSLQPAWTIYSSGTSPLIANGLLFYAADYIHTLSALNPLTGVQLWSTDAVWIHWQSPVVFNGTLYITSENGFLSAYAPVQVHASAYLPVVNH
jgi:outer membrane protein assembly factor BamB